MGKGKIEEKNKHLYQLCMFCLRSAIAMCQQNWIFFYVYGIYKKFFLHRLLYTKPKLIEKTSKIVNNLLELVQICYMLSIYVW